ncbi:hypothetical protein B0H16DRAFT_1377575 [Mycena metata]|uniref:F-box domain-containing protein n=1 Tax=Mycena metata TaxID=1033252 RepID=A0AAD7N3F7_9AGAR|nr:hypothetical protein B0H16DRAFT_1377575 [Mycena metata]
MSESADPHHGYDLNSHPFDPSVVSRDILETNHPPLESQIPSIREFIAGARARRIAIDAEIASLQSSLDPLVKERQALDLAIGQHIGAVSPLRRIPPEILCSIFAFTLPARKDARKYLETAPWGVSAVCDRWRTIVLYDPSFWTYIRLVFPDEGITRFRLETHLRRSGALPLTITFECGVQEFYTTQEISMLNILAQHSTRWEMLSFSGPYSALQYRSLHFPLLHELTIEMLYDDDDRPDDDDDDIPGLNFDNAPSLRRVTVNKGLWNFPVAMALPWSKVLQYGGSNTWAGHIHSLQSAANLVDCSLEIVTDIGDILMPRTPIILPRLLRLSLSDVDFLECLEAPILRELYCVPPAPALLAFLRRHSQRRTLQKLVLWEGQETVETSDLVDIMDAVPTLLELGMMIPLPVGFARLLCSRLDMAPALEFISATLPADIGGLHDQFTQAVELRWHASQLKGVKVYCPQFSSDSFTRMQLLHARGMDFMVYRPSFQLQVEHLVPKDHGIETEY